MADAAPVDPLTRIAEIRQENRGGDVSAKDIDWLCDVAETGVRRRYHRSQAEKERDRAVAALEQIEDVVYKARYPDG